MHGTILASANVDVVGERPAATAAAGATRTATPSLAQGARGARAPSPHVRAGDCVCGVPGEDCDSAPPVPMTRTWVGAGCFAWHALFLTWKFKAWFPHRHPSADTDGRRREVCGRGRGQRVPALRVLCLARGHRVLVSWRGLRKRVSLVSSSVLRRAAWFPVGSVDPPLRNEVQSHLQVPSRPTGLSVLSRGDSRTAVPAHEGGREPKG